MSINIGKAETWTPVGQAQWVEGIVTALSSDFKGLKWSVTIERSSENPYTFRMQPYINILRPKGILQVENILMIKIQYMYIYTQTIRKLFT